MFCSNCGNKLQENSNFCTKCGKAISINISNVSKTLDEGNVGWAFLGFFFPLVGLILYCCWITERPNDAKMIGNGVLILVIVTFLTILALILFSVLITNYIY